MLNHGVVRLRVTTSKWGRVWRRFAWVGPIQEKDHHVGMELVFSCPVESGTLRKHARNQVVWPVQLFDQPFLFKQPNKPKQSMYFHNIFFLFLCIFIIIK